MSMVARGLGLPRRGSIVAVGLGLALSTPPPVTVYPSDDVSTVISSDETTTISVDFETWAVVVNLDGSTLVTDAPTDALVVDLLASSEASADEFIALVSRQEAWSVVEDQEGT